MDGCITALVQMHLHCGTAGGCLCTRSAGTRLCQCRWPTAELWHSMTAGCCHRTGGLALPDSVHTVVAQQHTLLPKEECIRRMQCIHTGVRTPDVLAALLPSGQQDRVQRSGCTAPAWLRLAQCHSTAGHAQRDTARQHLAACCCRRTAGCTASTVRTAALPVVHCVATHQPGAGTRLCRCHAVLC